ncbi:MAG: hypothetical protein AAFQ64_18775 [Pseudomonadota bacterium]
MTESASPRGRAIAERIRREALRSRARAELSRVAAPSSRIAEFVPLAAAVETRKLPDRLISSNDALLRLEFDDLGNEIVVGIVALGFARVDDVRNRAARLVGATSALDAWFQFQSDGTATLRFTATETIRNALTGQMRLEIDQGDG